MASRYAYLAPKVFFHKGLLLRREGIMKLLGARDLDDLLFKLGETSYSPYLKEMRHPVSSRAIECAIRKSLVDTIYDLKNVTPSGPPREVMDSLLKRQAVDALKIILRAIIDGTINAIKEFYDPKAYVKTDWSSLIASMLEVEDLVRAISTISEIEPRLGKYVSQALRTYEELRDPIIFSIFLDKYVYDNLLGHLIKLKGNDKRHCNRLLGVLIDMYNIMTVIGGVYRGLPQEVLDRSIVSGYYMISRDLLESMVKSKSVLEAIEIFSRSRLSSELVRLGLRYIGPQDIPTQIMRLLRARSESIITSLPFSVGVAVATSLLKEFEVRDIALIASAIEARVKRAVIVENLIYM